MADLIPSDGAPAPQTVIFKAPSSASSKLVGYVLGAAALFFGGKYLYGLYEQHQVNKQADKAPTDENALAAEKLRQVVSTNSWGLRVYQTNDAAVLDILKSISDPKAVQDAYKTVSFGSNLVEDLRKGMSESNFLTALNILGIKGGSIKAKSDTSKKVETAVQKKSLKIITKGDTNIRKSPVVTGRFSLHPNVIWTAPPGVQVGWTYGLDKVYDPGSNVFFIPIKILLDDHSLVNAYVAASQVDAQPSLPAGVKVFSFPKFQYDNASAPLSGTSELSGASASFNSLLL